MLLSGFAEQHWGVELLIMGLGEQILQHPKMKVIDQRNNLFHQVWWLKGSNILQLVYKPMIKKIK
jgi:hypothetical protein